MKINILLVPTLYRNIHKGSILKKHRLSEEKQQFPDNSEQITQTHKVRNIITHFYLHGVFFTLSLCVLEIKIVSYELSAYFSP